MKSILLFGSTTKTGNYIYDNYKVFTKYSNIYTFSRRGNADFYNDLKANNFPKDISPKKKFAIISLAPIWLFVPYLESLLESKKIDKENILGLIVISSTSAITKKYAWNKRFEMDSSAPSIEEGLREAVSIRKKPVVLMDSGDNIGAGSSADSTHILHKAREIGVSGILQTIYDPEAVKKCINKIGSMVTLKVGGKSDSLHGDPIEVTGTVKKYFEGEDQKAFPETDNVINEGDEIEKDLIESRVGSAMSDLTTRRVIVLVLLMLLAIPFLVYSKSDESTEYATKFIYNFVHCNSDVCESGLMNVVNYAVNELGALDIKDTSNNRVLYSDKYSLRNLRAVEVEVVQYESIVAVYDRLEESRNDAIMGAYLTIFVMILLGVGYTFYH